MNRLFLLSALMLAFGSQAANANSNSVQLRSSENVEIEIQYAVKSAPGETLVNADAHVVVDMNRPDCPSRVRAVMTTFCGGGQFGGETLDLTPGDGCRFTSTQRVPVTVFSHAGVCQQQISVVVDGLWLTDPISGTHDFHYVIQE